MFGERFRFEPSTPGEIPLIPALPEIPAQTAVPRHSLDELMPRPANPWAAQFAGLSTLPEYAGPAKRLRICIATEDIVGPVRNGGIGTTYTALAELLAEAGHDVAILYLRGHDVENGTVEQWIGAYAEKRIRFVPVPNFAALDNFRCAANRWLRSSYNMLRYLLEHPVDVVHVSEWRGSAYFSLLAKKQGLAFQDTLFVVKTSSPWLWNRLHGSQPLERVEDLAKMHAERRSVELADVVIGGSAHMLRWMLSNGYRLPPGRTFTQPNVVSFEGLRSVLQEPSRRAGTRMPIDEIVFFGRLEARKGIAVFCQAINRLVRRGIGLPPKITFMGKPGGRLPFGAQQDVLSFIAAQSAAWPVRTELLCEFQQRDALLYLRSGARLAVMPSLIENSSLAVYETALCGIPFVASAVGGTPELIAHEDLSHVLCDPHPVSLADKIAEAVAQGGYIARPSFDNDANLEIWRGFHRQLSCGLSAHLLEQRRRDTPAAPVGRTVSVCLYSRGHGSAVAATLESLKKQDAQPHEVLIAVDAQTADAPDRIRALPAAARLSATVVDASDLDAGAAFDLVAGHATGDFLLFLWEGATLREHGLRSLVSIANCSHADVLNYLWSTGASTVDEANGGVGGWFIGSVAEGFFSQESAPLPLFVRRAAFQTLEGFTRDSRILAHDREFVMRAQIAGATCETALLNLGAVPAWENAADRAYYDATAVHVRAMRPLLAGAPLALQELLLLSRGLQGRGTRKKVPAEPRPSLLGGAIGRLLPGFLRRHTAGRRRSPGAPERATAPQRRAGATSLQQGVELRSEDGIRGRVFAARNGVIYGWAHNPSAPRQAVSLEVLVGGRVAASVVAKASLPAAALAPDAVGQCGFAVRALPWLPARRRRAPLIALRDSGSGALLAERVPVAAPSTSLEAAGYQGYCDASDHGLVQGWVWAPGAPQQVIDVAVFVDGQFLLRIPADRPRDDLRTHGVGDGHYGFQLPLDKSLRDGRLHRVEVVVANEGITLSRGRLLVRGQQVRPGFGWPRALVQFIGVRFHRMLDLKQRRSGDVSSNR